MMKMSRGHFPIRAILFSPPSTNKANRRQYGALVGEQNNVPDVESDLMRTFFNKHISIKYVVTFNQNFQKVTKVFIYRKYKMALGLIIL